MAFVHLLTLFIVVMLLETVSFGLTLLQPWVHIPTGVSPSSTPASPPFSSSISSPPFPTAATAVTSTTTTTPLLSPSASNPTEEFGPAQEGALIAMFALQACQTKSPTTPAPQPLFRKDQQCIDYNTMQRIAEDNAASSDFVKAVRHTRQLGIYTTVHFALSLFALLAAAAGLIAALRHKEGKNGDDSVLAMGCAAFLPLFMVAQGIFAVAGTQGWTSWEAPAGNVGDSLLLYPAHRDHHVRDIANTGIYTTLICWCITVFCCCMCFQSQDDGGGGWFSPV